MIDRPFKLLMLVLFSTFVLFACEQEESMDDVVDAPEIEDV